MRMCADCQDSAAFRAIFYKDYAIIEEVYLCWNCLREALRSMNLVVEIDDIQAVGLYGNINPNVPAK